MAQDRCQGEGDLKAGQALPSRPRQIVVSSTGVVATPESPSTLIVCIPMLLKVIPWEHFGRRNALLILIDALQASRRPHHGRAGEWPGKWPDGGGRVRGIGRRARRSVGVC